MEIKHDTQGSKGMFYISERGEIAAEMTYSKAGDDKIIIDHTDVSDDYRGKSYGLELVKYAVGYARESGIKVIPLCPFTKKMIDRHEELQDVLS